MKAIRFTADILRATINKHAIPQLIDYNFPGVTRYPKLRARRIGEANELRTISFALRNAVGAKVIIPDDDLEEWMRDELDLPRPDKSTARNTEAPQNPSTGGTPRTPKVGEPRQAPPSTSSQPSSTGGNS